ncbi:hypothetical protein KIPB_009663 [Kipferlia bialata]|uniref:Uncharacterized protein n=1 Tax=Kipferlia bialata TaxID=797122 RepID=A0A9K3D260_9EUKA|nr:hypothetical protein KIPB_009663 [Kipferlia bialata]|eukprot:g9663.t1
MSDARTLLEGDVILSAVSLGRERLLALTTDLRQLLITPDGDSLQYDNLGVLDEPPSDFRTKLSLVVTDECVVLIRSTHTGYLHAVTCPLGMRVARVADVQPSTPVPWREI